MISSIDAPKSDKFVSSTQDDKGQAITLEDLSSSSKYVVVNANGSPISMSIDENNELEEAYLEYTQSISNKIYQTTITNADGTTSTVTATLQNLALSEGSLVITDENGSVVISAAADDTGTVKYYDAQGNELDEDDELVQSFNEDAQDSVLQEGLRNGTYNICVQTDLPEINAADLNYGLSSSILNNPLSLISVNEDGTGYVCGENGEKYYLVNGQAYLQTSIDELSSVGERYYTEDDYQAFSGYADTLQNLNYEAAASDEEREYITAASNKIYTALVTNADGTTSKETLTLQNLCLSDETAGTAYSIIDEDGNVIIEARTEIIEDENGTVSYVVKYYDAQGNELDEDDELVQSFNEDAQDSILQEGLRNGTYTISVNGTAASIDELSSVGERYYTEDDAAAQAEYQKKTTETKQKSDSTNSVAAVEDSYFASKLQSRRKHSHR